MSDEGNVQEGDEGGGQSASEVNRELTDVLVEVGRSMGFTAVTEYVVPGGRLDVVWLWEPLRPIPGVVGSVPVAGFEIESSWRTRKHVKGDLLNLQDGGVALGVIVLAGADARDDSLRRFAESLVDRPGAQILVWTHDDVRALGAGEVAVTEVEAAASEVASRTEPANVDHTGKYRPLWAWLRQQERRRFGSASPTSNVRPASRYPTPAERISRTGTATKAVRSLGRSSTPAGTPSGST